MPQDQQNTQSSGYVSSNTSSPLYMQGSAPLPTSAVPVSTPTNPPTNEVDINPPNTMPIVASDVTNLSQQNTTSEPILKDLVETPDQIAVESTSLESSVKPESQANMPTVPQGLNVESIISEISEDLNNSLTSANVVKEEPKSLVDTTINPTATEIVADVNSIPQSNNLVTYNTNATDTFQENYQKEIQVANPVKIDSTIEGVKEIKRIEDDIKPQLVGGIDAAKDLQYKNYTLDEILKEAINRKASDVHFTQGYRATFRIDGELKTFNSQLLTATNIKEFAMLMIKNRPDINIETIKEVDLTYTLEDKRFRVNIFKQLGVYSIVCRVINETILSLDNLGLPPVLNSLTKYPNGLVIITGPTGSGKSTTLASLLNAINLSSSKHIVTLEDPVEYVLPKGLSIVDQREFGTDFMSWPNALKSVLRQDPNIVLVGEMRDLESIEAALQVAETGHLVFATLHTNSASQSIDRIIDVFPAERQSQIRLQLASVIRAVTSQRLIPMATGGRIPVIELVIANTAVQNAIREGKVFLIDNVIQTSAEEGMVSLEKSLVQMIKEGKISTQTAKTYSLKPNEIDMLLNK